MPIDLETLDERLSRLEGRVDEHENLFEMLRDRFETLERHIENRFNAADKRFESIENRLNHLDAKIDSKIDSLRDTNFRFFTWIIGLIIVSWLSTILLK